MLSLERPTCKTNGIKVLMWPLLTVADFGVELDLGTIITFAEAIHQLSRLDCGNFIGLKAEKKLQRSLPRSAASGYVCKEASPTFILKSFSKFVHRRKTIISTMCFNLQVGTE